MSIFQASVSSGRDGPVLVLSGEADYTGLAVLNDRTGGHVTGPPARPRRRGREEAPDAR